MKPMSCTIFYGKEVPNIPVLKNNLHRILTEKELDYAKKIANEFSENTLISKTFFDETFRNSFVEVTRKFSVDYDFNIDLKKEIIEYAVLIIFGTLFIDDNCPDILDVTLARIGTQNLVEDRALQQFVKGEPKNIFEITLSTRAWY